MSKDTEYSLTRFPLDKLGKFEHHQLVTDKGGMICLSIHKYTHKIEDAIFTLSQSSSPQNSDQLKQTFFKK